MTPAALAIARRLVAAPWWAGSVGPAVEHVYVPDPAPFLTRPYSKVGPPHQLTYVGLPDLSDHATAGVLLGMLDEATPKRLEVASESDGWWVSGPTLVGPCDTLGEAVALALLSVRGE